MDKWFRSKWFVRALSLAFAISLYIFVSVEENPNDTDLRFFGGSTETETVTDVPVGIRIDDDNYVVSGVPEFVNATLEGSKSAVTKAVKQRNFDVYVDLRGKKEGDHTVDIEYDNIPGDLSIFIEPKTIDVTIEQRATKEFPVSIDFINEDKLPQGYELGEVTTDPETVVITSSKTVIEQIAIVKVFVDVGGIEQSITNREVPVNVYDSQGNELRVNIEPGNVNVSVEVDNPSKTVPVTVETTGELPEGFELTSIESSTQEVEIFATSNILETIDAIQTEPIDLSDRNESGTFEVNLDLPEGVQVPNGNTIEIDLELEQTKAFEDISINAVNVREGQDVAFVQPNQPVVNITVTGNQRDIAILTKADFNVTVDVDGLDTGTHTLDVSISGPDDFTYTSNLEQVTVEIS
ncbi:CdaR family protein [Lentibacillus saliphilus]|uniref:CdaR family protein n=1 Tax=Lentibacillus saliphilus TaxID=2737028 RepID=UPI001C303A22|nr:CdaR family protein [Lentibacillus saliphilus]